MGLKPANLSRAAAKQGVFPSSRNTQQDSSSSPTPFRASSQIRVSFSSSCRRSKPEAAPPAAKGSERGRGGAALSRGVKMPLERGREFGEAAGQTGAVMGGKKVCIVGSGNWCVAASAVAAAGEAGAQGRLHGEEGDGGFAAPLRVTCSEKAPGRCSPRFSPLVAAERATPLWRGRRGRAGVGRAFWERHLGEQVPRWGCFSYGRAPARGRGVPAPGWAAFVRMPARARSLACLLALAAGLASPLSRLGSGAAAQLWSVRFAYRAPKVQSLASAARAGRQGRTDPSRKS